MKWTNELSQKLNIRYPVIQAPMFGVTTPSMVAAAAKANCLGTLSLGDLSADKCVEAIRATRQLTGQAFAVNIFVNNIPEITNELKIKYSNTKSFIEQLARKNNLDVHLPEIHEIKINSYHEQIDAIIAENCKILSFTFGNLDSSGIDLLKNNGTILIGTCTSLQEALALEKAGIDIICVQGIEAGGHRGSFSAENIPQIGGFSLLSQILDNVKIPMIYAGGIYNGKTLLAAQMLGAQGFQVGSLLLSSAESSLKDFEKQRLRNVKEDEIILTKSFSGRYARGIKNLFIEAIEHSDYMLPYPYQNKLTGELRRVAKLCNNADFVSMWVGQSIHPFSGKSTTEILENLITDTESI